jgi:hypothetical protein
LQPIDQAVNSSERCAGSSDFSTPSSGQPLVVTPPRDVGIARRYCLQPASAVLLFHLCGSIVTVQSPWPWVATMIWPAGASSAIGGVDRWSGVCAMTAREFGR